MKKLWLLTFISLFVCAGFALATTVDEVQNPAALNSFFSNPDSVVSKSVEAEVSADLKKLEAATTHQVAVVVLNSIGTDVPKDFAVRLFKKWGVGQKGKDNGVLLLAVMDQRRFEIEVGYGLEGVLTDATSNRIIQDAMIPQMRENGIDSAVKAGVALISQTVSGEVVSLPPSAATEGVNAGEIASIIFIGVMVLVVGGFFLAIIYFTIRSALNFAKDQDSRKRFFKSFLKFMLATFITFALFGIACVAFFGLEAFNLNFDIDGTVVAAVLAYVASMTVYLAILNWKRRRDLTDFLLGKSWRMPGWIFFSLVFVVLSVILFVTRIGISQKKNRARKRREALGQTFVDEEDEDQFLDEKMRFEEQIGSKEYDVFLNADGNPDFEEMELPFSGFKECTSCKTKAAKCVRNETVIAATTSSSGTGRRHFECGYCQAKTSEDYTIPVRTSSSSSGSSGGGSRGGGSGSGFGGGRSGGGGAGGSW